jgi:hypothetical protein
MERNYIGRAKRNSKLTEAIVVRMRREYFEGKVTQGELARRYGVSVETIRKALMGETWGWVGEGMEGSELPPAPAPDLPCAHAGPSMTLQGKLVCLLCGKAIGDAPLEEPPPAKTHKYF